MKGFVTVSAKCIALHVYEDTQDGPTYCVGEEDMSEPGLVCDARPE